LNQRAVEQPYDAAMIGTAVTSQPERTGPDWFGKVATRALSPLKPAATASAVGATAVQAYPSAARWRARRRKLGAGGFLAARPNRATNACTSCGESMRTVMRPGCGS
jgi:hypothetical protein